MHAAKIQLAPVDVCSWEQDALFGVFPQGARAKLAYLSPEDVTDSFLIPQHRYLFKRSKMSYPDQFLGEVVAYRIGQLAGVDDLFRSSHAVRPLHRLRQCVFLSRVKQIIGLFFEK